MNLNDGSEVAKLSYKPDVGEVIKIDETDKWYKVVHVNTYQKWCTCRDLPDPNF
jgi:hypothetical protein